MAEKNETTKKLPAALMACAAKARDVDKLLSTAVRLKKVGRDEVMTELKELEEAIREVKRTLSDAKQGF